MIIPHCGVHDTAESDSHSTAVVSITVFVVKMFLTATMLIQQLGAGADPKTRLSIQKISFGQNPHRNRFEPTTAFRGLLHFH